MRIARTTDGLYVGLNITEASEGDTITLGDAFEFYVERKVTLLNGDIMLSNPNYSIELTGEI